MLILQGVDISRLNREIRRGLDIVERVYAENYEEIVVTRTFKRIDSGKSREYGHDAFTVRLPIKLPNTIMGMVRCTLGPEYDVVKEQDHINIGCTREEAL